MSQACCSGVIRSGDGLIGKTAKWQGVDTYTTAPEKETKLAVIVIHDVFGFAIPNTKLMVDYFASKGFHAVMLDLFEGDAFPESKINLAISGDNEFLNWYTQKVSPSAWEKTLKLLSNYIDHLHSLGFEKVAAVGFCYGGSASAILSGTGKIYAATSFHGASHTVEELQRAKNPILYVAPRGDVLFPKQDEVAAYVKEHPDKGVVKLFEGVVHGFVNRGDFTDENVKSKAEEALEDTIVFLTQHAHL